MKINIGIDLNNGFCEIAIEGGSKVAFNNVDETSLKKAATQVIEMVTGAKEADDQVVVDGKIVTTVQCPKCTAKMLVLEKRTICPTCGWEEGVKT